MACSLTYPFSTIRARWQANPFINQTNIQKFNNITDVVKYIYKSAGFLGFFEGYLPYLIRVVPLTGLFFMFFETCKGAVIKKLESQPIY